MKKITKTILFKILSACLPFISVVSVEVLMLNACKAEAQNLFVSDNSSSIYEITPGGLQSTFATGMNYPTALAFDIEGDLFVANSANNSGEQGNITEIAPNGVQSVFASGVDPQGLAFDGAGNLYEADYESGNIYKFTPSGVQSTFATGFSLPLSLAFDSAGNLFVGAGWGYGNGYITKITPSGNQSLFASGLSFPGGLAFNNAGILFVSSQTSGSIYKFTPTGDQSTFATLTASSASGLAFDSAGDLLVANGGYGIITKISPGGVQSTFASGLANYATGLAFAVQPLTLSQDLTNSYVVLGQNATFRVGVSSQTLVSYQWYFVPSGNAGQAGAYAQIISDFVYGAVVTNGGFGYGNVPNVSFVGGGGSGASGFASVSNAIVTGITVTNAGYRYTSLPSVIIDSPNGFLFGKTNSTLTVSNANQNSLGNYYVVVSNARGSITSSVVNLTLLSPPSVTAQPADFYATALNPATFSVTANGTGPLFYQWLFNDTNLLSGTNSTLTITSTEQSNLGQYSVIITNSYGSSTSSIANLYMYPYLSQPFAGVDTYWGQTNTLSVGAWGSGNLSYQWYFNGVAINGATAATLPLGAIQFTNAGEYSVVVSSSLGSVTNATYQVVVNAANVSLALTPTVVIQGTVGYNYTVYSTTNLGDSNSWIVETNLTLVQSIQNWYDGNVDVSKPNHPQKFYRVVADQ